MDIISFLGKNVFVINTDNETKFEIDKGILNRVNAFMEATNDPETNTLNFSASISSSRGIGINIVITVSDKTYIAETKEELIPILNSLIDNHIRLKQQQLDISIGKLNSLKVNKPELESTEMKSNNRGMSGSMKC